MAPPAWPLGEPPSLGALLFCVQHLPLQVFACESLSEIPYFMPICQDRGFVMMSKLPSCFIIENDFLDLVPLCRLLSSNCYMRLSENGNVRHGGESQK